jgi:hypothetical protein
MMGGVAQSHWDSTGNVIVSSSYSNGGDATLKLIVQNTGAHIITKIDILPYPVTPKANESGCWPFATIDDNGADLTVEYNCTPPSMDTSFSTSVDIIMVFHVINPADPTAEFSPPMLHWIADISYTGSPSEPVQQWMWILVIAGSIVLIIIIVVFGIRCKKSQSAKQTSSDPSSKSQPLSDPLLPQDTLSGTISNIPSSTTNIPSSTTTHKGSHIPKYTFTTNNNELDRKLDSLALVSSDSDNDSHTGQE